MSRSASGSEGRGRRRVLLGAAIAACAANGACADLIGDLEHGCPESTVECDGACVDITSDRLHCGKCGYVCGSGVCASGACEIARNQDGPYLLAVDDDRLFWANASGNHTQTQIVAAYKDGSGVRTVTFDDSAPAALGVDDGYVYWAALETGTSFGHIARVSKGGSSEPEILDTAAAKQPRGLIVSDGLVYWGNVEDASVYRKDPSDPGAAAEVLATLQLNINQLARTEDALLWDAAFGIVRAPVVGSGFGEGELVAKEPDPIVAMYADGQDVFWIRPKTGDVVALRGSGPSSVLAAGLPYPGGIVADEENVYWTAQDGHVSAVSAVPRGGGDAVEIAQVHGVITAIAVDEESVYWVDVALGKVMKHARP